MHELIYGSYSLHRSSSHFASFHINDNDMRLASIVKMYKHLALHPNEIMDAYKLHCGETSIFKVNIIVAL